MLLSPLDFAALATFLIGWISYHVLVERSPFGRSALNNRMNEYRLRWMLEMQARDARIVDASLMASLQSGTSFFASTSLLALGGSLTLLRGADDALRILSDFPLASTASRTLWDLKVVGLTLIFGYAFFKFAWSYRLFNYASILIGATPALKSSRPEQRRLTALRAAEMNIVAGRHFNRGQRAFFFALAYLGWFVGPLMLIGTTVVVVVAILIRQFASDALKAVSLELPLDDVETVTSRGADLGPSPQGIGRTSEILPDRR